MMPSDAKIELLALRQLFTLFMKYIPLIIRTLQGNINSLTLCSSYKGSAIDLARKAVTWQV